LCSTIKKKEIYRTDKCDLSSVANYTTISRIAMRARAIETFAKLTNNFAFSHLAQKKRKKEIKGGRQACDAYYRKTVISASSLKHYRSLLPYYLAVVYVPSYLKNILKILNSGTVHEFARVRRPCVPVKRNTRWLTARLSRQPRAMTASPFDRH
jgi:hypothetical protein